MKRSLVAACVVAAGAAGWSMAQAASTGTDGWVYADTPAGGYSTSGMGTVTDSYSWTGIDGGQIATLSVSGSVTASAELGGLSISGQDSSSVSGSVRGIVSESFTQVMAGSYDPLHFTGAADGEAVTVRVGLGTSGRIAIAGTTGSYGWTEAYLSSAFYVVSEDSQGGEHPVGVIDFESATGSFSAMRYASIQVLAGTPMYLSGDLRANDQLGVGYTNSAQVMYSANSWFSFEVLTPGVGYFTDSGTTYATTLAVPEPGTGWMMLAGAGLLAVGLRSRLQRF